MPVARPPAPLLPAACQTADCCPWLRLGDWDGGISSCRCRRVDCEPCC
uniref:Uncharacterized protein n=1 Tax=Arundo donax TaxID=35708 RepID=A0A0A8ZRI9_ARUDO